MEIKVLILSIDITQMTRMFLDGLTATFSKQDLVNTSNVKISSVNIVHHILDDKTC